MTGALDWPDPPLTDGAVLLRPWTLDDLEQKHAGFSDPDCQRWSWPRLEPYTMQHAIDNQAEQEAARLAGTQLDLCVALAVDPSVVLGAVSLYDVSVPTATASIGYWTAAAARGRGVASGAVRLLATWSFEMLGLQRLELTCAPDNVASQRVATACGFTREALLRSHLVFRGTRRNTLVFGLLPGEFASA